MEHCLTLTLLNLLKKPILLTKEELMVVDTIQCQYHILMKQE